MRNATSVVSFLIVENIRPRGSPRSRDFVCRPRRGSPRLSPSGGSRFFRSANYLTANEGPREIIRKICPLYRHPRRTRGSRHCSYQATNKSLLCRESRSLGFTVSAPTRVLVPRYMFTLDTATPPKPLDLTLEHRPSGYGR